MDKDIILNPIITVLLPVYNSQRYIKEAIESILSQTFIDFELLIINDGSTDKSKKNILSFTDSRIKYVENEKNIGLIATLNKGIDLAKGKYIARMDADDIALPDRFAIQLEYIKKDTQIALVCSPVECMNSEGIKTKGWDVDMETKTWEQIKNMLPKTNCLAHPTVLIKSDILKKYKYGNRFKGSEDWELWMRLVSDGYKIVKTKETLLKYRIHTNSITISGKQNQSVDKKTIKVKRAFLAQQFAKFKVGFFELKVLYSLIRSIGRNYKLNIVPKLLRNTKRLLTINPIKAYKQYQDFKNSCEKNTLVDLFFFFPYCHIGGAEKVHANIVEVFSDKKVLVFITGISNKDNFLYMFQKFASAANIGLALNYPLFENQIKKAIYNLIEKQTYPVVLGCNNMFFYESVLKFSDKVKVFDLMHDFRFSNETNITHEFLPQFLRCEKRIFISKKAINETIKFYKSNEVDQAYFEKIEYIPNYTFLPKVLPVKDYNQQLKVLYVGRDTAEKRAYLVHKIAEKCRVTSENIVFTAIGELTNLNQSQAMVNYVGPVYDFNELEKYYNEYHVVLITSEREGFPLAIMEGMAHGLVPVSTPVGDVPIHIGDEVGFVTASIDEKFVVEEMAEKILFLNDNRSYLKNMSSQAYIYAKKNFSQEEFSKKYKLLLNS